MIQAAAVLLAIVISPGLYHDPSGAAIYVGAQHEVPDRSNAQYLDARNGLTGELKSHQHLAQTCRLHEERRLVRYDGVLGVFAVLCRQCAARDADAIYDAFHSDARVDPRRMGVWGFSNGGWTAPIVAVDRPMAFMILKSAPAESIEQNTLYEQRQAMQRAGHGAVDVDAANAALETLMAAIQGRVPVATAQKVYARAKHTKWFDDSFLPLFPEKTAFAEPQLSGWRRYVTYDPAPILAKVHTPTLALYGARDRKVDVHHDVPLLVAAYDRSKTRDLTVKWFADAGHPLKVSPNGFDDAVPQRYDPGFPEVMLRWLRERNFIR